MSLAPARPGVATATPPSSAGSSPLPREGAYREEGVVRHARIHALRYRLKGTCKVLREVDVTEAILHGTCSVGGSLTADRLMAEGTVETEGDLAVAELLAARGTLRVGGTLTAGALDLEGLGLVAKDVSVSTGLSFRGTLETGGNVSAALFAPDGHFAVAGRLTAREVSGKFDGPSCVDQVHATTVTLRPKALVRLPVDVPPLRPKGSLTVTRIEAESVELEGVTVRYLQAPTIVLGRYCHVTRAEGTIVRCDRTSHVGYESRSPPPAGLSR